MEQGVLALKGNSVAVQLRYDVSLTVPIRQQAILQKISPKLLCRLSIAVMSGLLLYYIMTYRPFDTKGEPHFIPTEENSGLGKERI
jgi:hypothetical protein